jgi:hypothetical protein
MQHTIPDVPWQLTGNHWISLPCIHPVDGSLYAVGLLHRASRSAIEFAGSRDFASGTGRPLLRPTFTVDGAPYDLSGATMAWETALGWVPTFTAAGETLVVRGTVFAPYGRDSDLAGAVYAFALENRGTVDLEVVSEIQGTLGHRQLRVRSARPAEDPHRVRLSEDVIVLEGAAQPGTAALAIAADGSGEVEVHESETPSFVIRRKVSVPAKGRAQLAFYLAVGPEGDGAEATVRVLRRRGWHSLLSATRDALQSLEQSCGDGSIDQLINRNLLFCYFYAVGRAVDDAQYYLVRTRIPWHERGVTIRDWEALAWIVPAIQLADPALARELILRACELHGYAPGQGVRYLDGTLFEPGFSLEGAAAYAVAMERYIRETGDDRIVDEPIVGDTLYLSHDDIAARRHRRLPLYSTEVTPGGEVAPYAYTLHGNAVVAMALDVFGRTLDEATARDVADPAAVRAALRRHFTADAEGGRRFVAAADLEGATSVADDPVGSVLWIPLFDAVERNDSEYRRTAKSLEAGGGWLAADCARLLGPDSASVLKGLQRAGLDRGLAAEKMDADGKAESNGGDAALAGLLAWSVWYAVHAMGTRE